MQISHLGQKHDGPLCYEPHDMNDVDNKTGMKVVLAKSWAAFPPSTYSMCVSVCECAIPGADWTVFRPQECQP